MTERVHWTTEAARHVEETYTTPDVAEQRALCLRLLDLREGERVLDVGCGPGFFTLEAARLVGGGGGGRVVGVDMSEPMLALASKRCEGQSNVELRRGDAGDPTADELDFDAIICAQVLEYVDDVDRALASFGRRLKAGGRALLLDTDWTSLRWESADPARMAAVLKAWEEHAPHMNLPSSLPDRLARAGFEVERHEVRPFENTTLENTYSGGLLRFIEGFAPGRNGLSETDARAWAEELRGRDARGGYAFSLDRHVFVAKRSG